MPLHGAIMQCYSLFKQCGARFSISSLEAYLAFPCRMIVFAATRGGPSGKQVTRKRYAVKCVKRADLPPEDEADLKMEVKLLQEVR